MFRSRVSGTGSSNSAHRQSEAADANTSNTTSSSRSRLTSNPDLQSYRSARSRPTSQMSELERTRHYSQSNADAGYGSRWARSDLSREHYTDSEANNAHSRFTQTVADLSERFGSAVAFEEPGASVYRSLSDEAATLASAAAGRNMRYESSNLGPRGSTRDDLISRLSSYSDRYEENRDTLANTQVRQEDFNSEGNFPARGFSFFGESGDTGR